MQVFMFPGQGSQKRGMGQGLFDQVPQFLAVEPQIDALLGYSLRALCLEDEGQRLKETQCTQPALYVVNALHHYQALAEGAVPDVLVGHSLGEYNALLAAGAFDLLTGLRLVQKRGELMAQARDGGMVAVVGLSVAAILSVLADQGHAGVDVANFNAPSQTVISGPIPALQALTPALEAAGAKMVVPLAVSAAFHSRYMFDASLAFDAFLSGFEFAPLQRTVVANVTGRPYPDGNPTAHVRAYLVRQMAHPVQWTRSVQYLLDQGGDQWREIGPGQVLQRLLTQIRPAAVPHTAPHTADAPGTPVQHAMAHAPSQAHAQAQPA